MGSVWRNNELEAAVVGAMLLRGADPEVLEVISVLPDSVFNVPQYREIYNGIRRQAKGQGLIDMILLCESLPALEATILEASSVAWAKSSLKAYAAMLRRNAAIRDAESALKEALQGIQSAGNGEMAVEALEGAKQLMAGIDIAGSDVVPMHIDDLLPVVVARIESRVNGTEEGRAIRTGIAELDTMTGGGFDQTDLVLLAARPSMGKTELTLDLIDRITEQGSGVLFFSLEMADIQIAERMVSAAGGLPVSVLKQADALEDEDWARIFNGVSRMTGRPIWIVDITGLSVDEICQAATSHILAHPETALVAVDYLGLIKTAGRGRHDLEVGDISKGLKKLAKTNKRPVLALSQLSRGVESRPNKRPVNADLKNSGEIEADADIIMMLYRDGVYNPESPARHIAEINVTKNRNGPLGTVYRRFFNGHFLDIDQEEARGLSTPAPVAQKSRQHRYAKV
jgi:replicative DNA helicase